MLALKFDRKKYDRNLKEEGREEGREEERWQLLIAMVNDGEITTENAAKRLNITPEEFQEKLTAIQNK